MIVPENEPIVLYKRQELYPGWRSIAKAVLNWPDSYPSYSYCPLISAFNFTTTPQGAQYWYDLYNKAAIEGTNFVLPPEARTYIEWLFKEDIKNE